MKNMKKILCVLMTMVMVLSMSVSVFAEDTKPGSITIGKAVEGYTYKVYKLMDVQYSDDLNAYTYTADPDWSTFLQSSEIKGKYITITDDGYISWVTNADAQEFAQKAKKYAVEKNIDADAEQIATSATVEFTNLELGYYLVDSSVGIMCSLDTTVPHVSIDEKNGEPTNEKKVIRPDGDLAETASYQIGDTVPFISKIVVYNGVENLVYHDKMEEGLTLNQDSIQVYYAPKTEDSVPIDASNYQIKYGADATTNHEVHGACTNADDCKLNGTSCTFEIIFEQSFLDSLTTDVDTGIEELSVYYTAVLNEKAKIIPDVNINNSKITFGDNGCSVWDDALVYTYRFDIVKVDEFHKVLRGAKFELYNENPDKNTSATPVKLVIVSEKEEKDADDNVLYTINTYRLATDADTNTVTEIDADYAIINGIRVNYTYYLKETQAPKGYNALSESESFTLTEDEVRSGSYGVTIEAGVWKEGGLHIVNKTGALMPETGGIGTTLFYVIGGILFVGAAVVLVVRKRMSHEA